MESQSDYNFPVLAVHQKRRRVQLEALKYNSSQIQISQLIHFNCRSNTEPGKPTLHQNVNIFIWVINKISQYKVPFYRSLWQARKQTCKS